jgi:hypothetical protein
MIFDNKTNLYKMKTILRLSMMIAAIMTTVIFSACNREKKGNNASPEQLQKGQALAPFSDHARKAFVSDPFTLKASGEAGTYFLKQHYPLQIIARRVAFGGTFGADNFAVPMSPADTSAGVKLWYCYNPSDKDYPKLFLALERIANYNENDPLESPKTPCIVPSTFKYDEKGEDPEDVKKYMKKQQNQTRSPKYTIEPSKVIEFSNNFKSLISIISPDDPIHGIDSLCQYPIAVFKYKPAYETFMSKKPDSVRYFFGLAKVRQHKPNYIRTILVGMDKNGIINDQPENQETYGILLQKSVPPPPIQEF